MGWWCVCVVLCAVCCVLCCIVCCVLRCIVLCCVGLNPNPNPENWIFKIHNLQDYIYVSREGLAPIVKAYSRLILVDGLVL